MASLKYPHATYDYIERYLFSMTDYGLESFNRITLYSCIMYLMELDSKALDMTEEEFQRNNEL